MQAKEVHVARHHTTLYNEHDIAVLTLHNTNLSMLLAKACCTRIAMLTQEEDVCQSRLRHCAQWHANTCHFASGLH